VRAKPLGGRRLARGPLEFGGEHLAGSKNCGCHCGRS
jgi:hypothetical protein